MDESQDSAAFTALCLAAGPSRAERVRKVLREARETLARSRGNEQFRERAEPLGVVPEWRSRECPLSSRDRTTAAPAPASQPDAPTWEHERAAVFDAICALRERCETLSEQLAEMRSSQTRELGMFGAWRALKQWSDEECTRIEAAGRSRDDQDKKAEPFEIPSLRTLRQT
jgi:hypothetical protein